MPRWRSAALAGARAAEAEPVLKLTDPSADRLSSRFLEHAPWWPLSSPPIGSVISAHFDDPVRLAYTRDDNRQRWFVAGRRKFGFEALQAPREVLSNHGRRPMLAGPLFQLTQTYPEGGPSVRAL